MAENSRLRIHAQITPESALAAEKKVRWKSIPHPGNRPERVRKKLSPGDRLLRNSAIACALLLAILALGNIDRPWARRGAQAVQKALTMHIDLDDSLGRLNFVRDWMPDSALVFLNLSGKTEMQPPSAGSVTHAYQETQPWLLFESAGGDVLAPLDGVVTAVCTLGNGSVGLLIDHGSGLESVCAHLTETAVASGDKVSRGDRLGAAAGQLYYELRENQQPIDPSARMGLDS